jgi:hypothetical protein
MELRASTRAVESAMTRRSTWIALQNQTFSKLWFATLVSRTCVSAHDTATTWAMSSIISVIRRCFLPDIESSHTLRFPIYPPAGALADMTDVVYGIHSAGCVRRWTCDLGLIETPDFVCLPPNFYANELQRIRRPSWGSKPRVLWKRTVH